MKTDTQIRNQLLRKIHKIPTDKLQELNDFISQLEGTNNKKDKILSFAGAWENIDESMFNDFTNHLLAKRKRNKRRINE